MQNNPIQERIDTLYNKWKSAINKKAVKIVRILSEHDEQDMIASFFKYLLDVEGQQEEFVFVLNSPFSTLESFGNELIKEIEEEVNNWNKATMPDDISFEKIEWNPNYTIDNNKNTQKGMSVSVIIKKYGVKKTVNKITVFKCSFQFPVFSILFSLK